MADPGCMDIDESSTYTVEVKTESMLTYQLSFAVEIDADEDSSLKIEDPSNILDKMPHAIVANFKSAFRVATGMTEPVGLNPDAGSDPTRFHQEIQQVLNKKVANIPVKTFRSVIPKMMMSCFLPPNEWQQKEKIKNLWEKPPENYPEDVPFLDPNNGKRHPNGTMTGKPKRAQLEAMFLHLKNIYDAKVVHGVPLHNDTTPLTPAPPTPVASSGHAATSATPAQSNRSHYEELCFHIPPLIRKIERTEDLPVMVSTEENTRGALANLFDFLRQLPQEDAIFALEFMYTTLHSHAILNAMDYDTMIEQCKLLSQKCFPEELQEKKIEKMEEHADLDLLQSIMFESNINDLADPFNFSTSESIPAVVNGFNIKTEGIVGQDVMVSSADPNTQTVNHLLATTPSNDHTQYQVSNDQAAANSPMYAALEFSHTPVSAPYDVVGSEEMVSTSGPSNTEASFTNSRYTDINSIDRSMIDELLRQRPDPNSVGTVDHNDL